MSDQARGWLAMAAWGLLLLFAFAVRAAPLPDDGSGDRAAHREELARLLEEIAGGNTTLAGIRLQCPRELLTCYRSRNRRPAWTGDPGAIGRRSELSAALAEVRRDGVPAGVLHAAVLDRLSPAAAAAPYESAVVDLLVTDALLAAVHHLAGDAVPVARLPEKKWSRHHPAVAAEAVVAAVMAGERPAAAVLADLRPADPTYRRLRWALARLAEIREAGGWVTVPGSGVLRPGDRSSRIPFLRARLAQACELLPVPADPRRFDPALAAAVRRFQQRCGLPADGVVGPRTLAALNTPVEQRLRQVAVNLARLRMLSRAPAPRRLEVNIPDFRLEYVVDDSVVLAMPVVVGRPDRPTPVLESAVTRIRFNPVWKVPQKLARHDLLPHLRRDPDYASRLRLRVFASWADDAPELDPTAQDWQAVRPEHLSFRFQADPGPRNPLGKVEFLFPNPWRVFLHDTSHRELFEHHRRCFSSGCVRLGRPLALARRLLADDPGGDPAAVAALLATERTADLPLERPVPIRVMYLTAWVDRGGTLQFREDVYGEDEAVWRALQGPVQAAPTLLVQGGAGLPLPGRVLVSAADR